MTNPAYIRYAYEHHCDICPCIESAQDTLKKHPAPDGLDAQTLLDLNFIIGEVFLLIAENIPAE